MMWNAVFARSMEMRTVTPRNIFVTDLIGNVDRLLESYTEGNEILSSR
jgi:hypothetical protein